MATAARSTIAAIRCCGGPINSISRRGPTSATRPPRDPLASPIHAAYGPWLPPTLLTSGTRDLFLSDCVRLQRRMRRAGAPSVRLEVWEEMWHAFNTQPHLPEGAEARAEMAAFLLRAVGLE